MQEQCVRAEARHVERRERGLALLLRRRSGRAEASEASEPNTTWQRHRLDKQRSFSFIDQPGLSSPDPVRLQAGQVRGPGRDVDGAADQQEDPDKHVQTAGGEPGNEIARLAFNCYSFLPPWLPSSPRLGHLRLPARSCCFLWRTLS